MTAKLQDPETLLSRFGLTEFRPGQKDVIDSVGRGEDVLCVMPTGGGKSLCYQLPSLARDGTTIVVSPLIALMKDQVDTLRGHGFRVALINSTQTLREQEEVMESLALGEFDLIYVAPERLRNGRFIETLERARISLLAVDEAHCVSEWGHDFRPDYARLGDVRKKYLSNVQTIALTATATPTVRDDVCALLGLQSPKVFVTGFARTNLRFGVCKSTSDAEKDQQLVDFIGRQKGAGIIYGATRKACEAIGQWLPERTGRPIGVYHGGMDSEQRRIVQERFMSGELDAIVATNAFGMGIDKSEIRYVAHYNLPGTLEAYYQEAGRAGRDGLESDCQLFFSYHDRYIQEFFIENRYPSKETVRDVYQYLLGRTEDPIELTLDQVRDAIGADSSEAVGTAEALLAKSGVLRRLDSSSNQMLVRIDSDAPTIVDLLPREAKLRRRVMGAVEKVVGKRRNDDVYVRPKRLMELASVDREQMMRTLRELSRLNAFDYVPPFRGRAVHFVKRDVKFDSLSIDFDELARRKAGEFEKLESVIGFARTGGCRQRVILDYFGDKDVADCGKCDRCDSGKRPDSAGGVSIEGMSPADAQSCFCGLRVILSGITRMHGRFGKNMVAQMLCGSQNKRMSQWKLQRLSTYGMLSTMKQGQLIKVIDALIDHGMVEQREVDQRRPTVEISDLGKLVMHLRKPLPESFRLSKPVARTLAVASRGIESSDVSAAADVSSVSLSEESTEASADQVVDGQKGESAGGDEGTSWQRDGEPSSEGIAISLDDLTSPEEKLCSEVSDRLKRWRRRISAALGIPAYRVLTNSTIDRLSEIRPENSSELEEISGIGPATMEQHGYDLLELIRECLGEFADGDATEPATAANDQVELAEIEEPVSKAGTEEGGSHGSGTGGLGKESENRDVDRAGPPAGMVTASEPSGSSKQSAAAQEPGRANGDSESVSERDSYWTWRLFSEGFTLEEVCQIRRLTRREISRHLSAAEGRGRAVSPTWQS